jgi:hypothetical protein
MAIPAGHQIASALVCLAMTGGRPSQRQKVIASLFYLSLRALFYCHCERSVAIPAGHQIASALVCLAMTRGDVIASRRRGNPGGASDCFGTNVPRNDRGDVIASAAWQSPDKILNPKSEILNNIK